MSDLVAFLTARLDEDEAVARAAFRRSEWLVADDFTVYAEAAMTLQLPVADMWTQESADHVARHDPARVLREVAAKRKILERHSRQVQQIWRDQRVVGEGPPSCGYCSDREEDHAWPCPDVLALAAVYSDHPDYDPGVGVSAWPEKRSEQG